MVNTERLTSNHVQFISTKSVLSTFFFLPSASVKPRLTCIPDSAAGLGVDNAYGFNQPVPLNAWYHRAHYDHIKNTITVRSQLSSLF